MLTSERQLIHLASGQWNIAWPNWNLAGTGADGIALDQDGRLWIATERVIATQTSAGFETVFEEPARDELRPGNLAASHHGGCWAALNGCLKRFEQGRCVEDVGPFPWSKGDL